jgi:hypothetical protein
VLGEEADPVERELAHAPNGDKIELALDPDENGLAPQLGLDLAPAGSVERQRANKNGSNNPKIGDVLRHRVEALRVDRHGEGSVFAVEDGAAVGEEVEGALALSRVLLLEELAFEHL